MGETETIVAEAKAGEGEWVSTASGKLIKEPEKIEAEVTDVEVYREPKTVEDYAFRILNVYQDMPELAKHILIRRACGETVASIGKALTKNEATIRYYIREYKLDGMSKEGQVIMALMVNASLRAIQLTALGSLKLDDITKLSAKDRVYLANQCQQAMNMNKSKPIEVPKKSEKELIAELPREKGIGEDL